MTELLEKAMGELARRPADEQDRVARWLLDILKDEQRWDEAFEHSQEELTKLASKVRSDIRGGRTRQAGIDEL